MVATYNGAGCLPSSPGPFESILKTLGFQFWLIRLIFFPSFWDFLLTYHVRVESLETLANGRSIPYPSIIGRVEQVGKSICPLFILFFFLKKKNLLFVVG